MRTISKTFFCTRESSVLRYSAKCCDDKHYASIKCWNCVKTFLVISHKCIILAVVSQNSKLVFFFDVTEISNLFLRVYTVLKHLLWKKSLYIGFERVCNKVILTSSQTFTPRKYRDILCISPGEVICKCYLLTNSKFFSGSRHKIHSIVSWKFTRNA